MLGGSSMSGVSRVFVLPDVVASQVAAGEVVERPSSVLKELVENSLDAGAGEIRVEIQRGGVLLIRVTDDGSGMSREDAMLALERHATSKLRNAADLSAIRTMGFRGEAVPSIASVSKFRLITREADSVEGTELIVEGGTLRDVRAAGAAVGTTIEVRSLFFNVPARRKFLRAESTEAAHIEHQLRLHALAYPNVRFRFRKDEREVFDLPATERHVERVRQLFGTEVAEELIGLPAVGRPQFEAHGLVLPASHARKGRRHQYVFLNQRPVEDPFISRALAEGFRGELMDGMHPAAWLWLNVDPGLVDVNVHPAKREVRFHRPGEVRELVLAAVTTGLEARQKSLRKAVEERVFERAATVRERESFAAGTQPMSQPVPPVTEPSRAPALAFRPPDRDLPGIDPEKQPGKSRQIPPSFRFISLLHGRYALIESDGGLVLMDPVAAQERILYEQAMRRHGGQWSTQVLLVPILLDLDPRDADLLLRERDGLTEVGIDIDGFGGNTIRIAALPSAIDPAEARGLIAGLLDELLHGAVVGARFAHDRVARCLAAKLAAKTKPSAAQIESLLDSLFQCDLPYCAADGRPTLTEIGLPEIERRFGGAR